MRTVSTNISSIGAHEASLGRTDVLSVSMQGDDIQDFDGRWDQALSSASDMPKANVQERLY